MTTNRTIGGHLDYGKFLPDPDALRSAAREHARDDLRRAQSALHAAAEGEHRSCHRDALAAAHAAVCDAVALLEACA
ncbi:MAG: hypothetical protein IT483_15685 [Gammaproteobacteria bacterium]|nr:hypothetical protein [Gammaproteobacteria bacterium]